MQTVSTPRDQGGHLGTARFEALPDCSGQEDARAGNAIDTVAFHHVELFDGEKRKLRLSLRVMAGKFSYYEDEDDHLALSMTLPFPLVRLTANGARFIAGYLINIPASNMFASDGSLYVQLTYRAAHVTSAPGLDYGIAKYYPIGTLSEAPGPLDGWIFGTDAPSALNGDAFPLPARLFREARGIIRSPNFRTRAR
jgi:hypothetical protein